jgi:aminoglycoside 6'-N-acetyltransferase
VGRTALGPRRLNLFHVTAEPDLTLVPLRRTDFPLLVDWLAQPHVARWWKSPKTLHEVEAEFGPCLDGSDPTVLFLVRERDRSIGLVQIYRMVDNPDYAAAVGFLEAGALDLFIGDPADCNRGLGSALIALACDRIWSMYPEVSGVVAGPSVRNERSIRAFEKAGFQSAGSVTVPGEDEEERIVYRDRPTKE